MRWDRKGHQYDRPGRHWGRWSLSSTSPIMARAVILTTFPFQWWHPRLSIRKFKHDDGLVEILIKCFIQPSQFLVTKHLTIYIFICDVVFWLSGPWCLFFPHEDTTVVKKCLLFNLCQILSVGPIREDVYAMESEIFQFKISTPLSYLSSTALMTFQRS